MKMFFAKDVQFAIQRHISIESLCERYDCTEAEFNRRLRQLYKHSTDDVISRIKKSADKAAKPAKKPDPIPEPAPTEVADDDETYLLELRASEITLREEIYRLEIDYEDHAVVHRDCIRQIKAEKEEIDKLTSELEDHLARVKLIANQNNSEVATMNSLCAARRTKREDLENVQAQIAELTRVRLYVEADGNIRVKSSSIEIDDTGSAELAAELFADQRYESYRVVAIRTAARVISVVSHLSIQAEVDFADDEVGLVFLEYADAHQPN